MIEIDAKKIGKIIAGLRKKKGESQRELADLMDLSPGSIAQYETGTRMPSDNIKIKMAQHFGVPVHTIFFSDDDSEVDIYPNDPEVREIVEKIYENDNIRILFDKTKNATKEDVQFVLDVAERLIKEND